MTRLCKRGSEALEKFGTEATPHGTGKAKIAHIIDTLGTVLPTLRYVQHPTVDSDL